MTDLYAPKPGSLPDRVLAFLEANPEEGSRARTSP